MKILKPKCGCNHPKPTVKTKPKTKKPNGKKSK